MTGITLWTAAALLLGLCVHGLKQYGTARRLGVDLTTRVYWLEHWHETAASVACAVVLYLALPEVATLFPDVARMVGLAGTQTVLSSFCAGFFGNSLADLLGARAKMLTGGQS